MDPQDTSTDDHSTSMIESRQGHHTNRQSSSSFLKSKRKSNMYDSFSFNNNDNNAQSMLENVGRNQQSSEYIGLVSDQYDKQQRLKQVFVLQQYLQKQHLMLVKEQTQKSKFIKQIEDEMKNYYSLLIQMKDRNRNKDCIGGEKQGLNKKRFQFSSAKKPLNRIVTDDGFDNCSNFIKQIIIHTSRNYDVAIVLLMNCTISQDQNEKGSIYIKDYLLLVDLFVNVLYERVSQTDPFLKEITKLICELLARLPKLRDEEECQLSDSIKGNQSKKNDKIIKTNYQKVQKIFDTFMQKQQIQDYFEILSNNILKKIQKISFQRAQIRSRVGISLHQSNSILTENSLDLDKQLTDPTSSFGFKFQQNWMEYVKPQESFNEQKRALAMSFLSQVYSQADLCPIGLKIVLKYFYQKQFQYYFSKYPQKPKSQIKQLTSLRLWQLIQSQYINKLSPEMSKQSILFKQMSTYQLQIVEEIKKIVMGFFNCKKTQGYLSDDEFCDAYRKSKKFINKVVQKLLSFNQEKYDKFVQTIKENSLQNVQPSMKKVKSEVVNNKKGEKEKNNNVNEIQSFVSQSEMKEINDNNNKKQISQKKIQQKPAKQVSLSSQLLRIYGGCISFKQLQILLQSLRRLLPLIPNQRIINRTQRIFDMSPQLQFLTKHKLVKHPNQIQFMYIILLQHELDQLISNDYRVLYTKEYETDKVKSMIRQIVCQLKLKQLSKRVNKRDFVHKKKVNKSEFQLEDLKSFKKGGIKISPQKAKQKPTEQNKLLINLLQKISDQCSKSVQGTQVQYSLHKGISLQLLKKIKYLLYMFKNKSSQLNQPQILSQMLNEVKNRSENMRRIYQHTKFGLLAAIGNIKHYKNLLISKKEIQMKIESRVEKILLLESVHLSLCMTSPYTRSHPQFGLKHQQSIIFDNQHSSFASSKSPQKNRHNQSPSKMSSSSFNKQKQSHTLLPQKFQQIKNPKQSNVFFEPFNKYKYRISNADDIVICSTQDCIHKDNIFMGLSYHLNSIQEFIQMFSALRQVGENLFFAGYVIPQQLSRQMDKQLYNELKTFTPITHPLVNLFMSKKYQKLHYSIDKINTTFYEFIDYIMQQKIPQLSPQSALNKHQMTEIKRVLKDILLRGIHSKLVKKIQNNIKVNLLDNLIMRSPLHNHFNNNTTNSKSKTNTKQQSHRINCLINHGLDVPNSSPHILTSFIVDDDMDGNGDQEGNYIEEESIVKVDDIGNKQSVSEEIRVWDDQELRSSTLVNKKSANREVHQTNRRGLRNGQQKNTNKMISLNKQQGINEKDTTIYQSRNDQILLYQIQRIHNLKRFQLFNRHNNNQNTHQLQTNQNMKQLQQVCARYIKAINKKQTPEDKIQQLKQISEIFKLVGKGGDDSNKSGSKKGKYQGQGLKGSRVRSDHSIDGKESRQYFVQQTRSAQKSSQHNIEQPHDNNSHHHQHHHNYTIQTLIFRSLIIAQPPNFITNLAFIQMFLHKDKMLSNQGKILNQFKDIVKQIFQFKDIEKYLGMVEEVGKQGEKGKSGVDFNNDEELNGMLTRIKDLSNREMCLP